MSFPNRKDFADEEGIVNEYAYRIALRSNADALYLSRWRMTGHEEAALEVCDEYGHEARAGICDRCGQPVTASEIREQRARTRDRGNPA